MQLCVSLKFLRVFFLDAWHGMGWFRAYTYIYIYVCIFFNFELSWFDLFMCFDALHINAAYIACVMVFFTMEFTFGVLL